MIYDKSQLFLHMQEKTASVIGAGGESYSRPPTGSARLGFSTPVAPRGQALLPLGLRGPESCCQDR